MLYTVRTHARSIHNSSREQRTILHIPVKVDYVSLLMCRVKYASNAGNLVTYKLSFPLKLNNRHNMYIGLTCPEHIGHVFLK